MNIFLVVQTVMVVKNKWIFCSSGLILWPSLSSLFTLSLVNSDKFSLSMLLGFNSLFQDQEERIREVILCSIFSLHHWSNLLRNSNGPTFRIQLLFTIFTVTNLVQIINIVIICFLLLPSYQLTFSAANNIQPLLYFLWLISPSLLELNVKRG